MSSCLVFVFLSLIEYALVNIILGDIVDSEEALAKHAGGVRSSVFAHTSKLLYKNVSYAPSDRAELKCHRSLTLAGTSHFAILHGTGGGLVRPPRAFGP